MDFLDFWKPIHEGVNAIYLSKHMTDVAAMAKREASGNHVH